MEIIQRERCYLDGYKYNDIILQLSVYFVFCCKFTMTSFACQMPSIIP